MSEIEHKVNKHAAPTVCLVQFQLELRLQLRLLVKLLHDELVLLEQMGRVLLAPGELLLQRKVHVMGLLKLGQNQKQEQ